jgi:hypothetical protein
MTTQTQAQRDKHGMPPVWHLRLGIRVLSRIFDLFVAWPATLVATFLVVIGLTGEPPERFLTDSAFRWAETSFRAAPAGMINVPVYVDHRPEDGGARPPIERILEKVSTATVEQGKGELSDALTTWYWRLVSLAGLLMFAAMGWRKFFVVPAAISAQKY